MRTARLVAIFVALLSGTATASAAPATRLDVSRCPRCSFVPPFCPFAICSTSTDSGSALSLTVAAVDAMRLADAGYAGTVVFSSSDSSAVLPAPYTFGASDAGAAVISGFVLNQPGAQTVTATDSGNPALTGTLELNVAAPAVPVSGSALMVMTAILAALGTWLSWRRAPSN